MDFLIIIGGCVAIYWFFFKRKSKPQKKTQKTKIEPHIEKETGYETSVFQGDAGDLVSLSTSHYQEEGAKNKAPYETPVLQGDTDGLASFSTSHYQEEEKTKNKEPGRWVKPGEAVVVNGQSINQGYFYLGGKLNAYDPDNNYYSSHETEASLVDATLEISNETSHYSDESLGYWPKFISLTPSARGAYIDWLSSDRSSPLTPVGYVFIYFYGLERRILVDASRGIVDDDEYVKISGELKRLRSIFRENYSFKSYSTRLIDFMAFTRPSVLSLSDDELAHDSNYSMLFKLRLATIVEQLQPVSAALALAWIKFYPEYSLRTPARRCDDEFSHLFKQRYSEKYGRGMTVKLNKTKLKLEYHPASSTILHVEMNQRDLPDPSMLKAPINKLIAIADKCMEDLDAYSRYLGKKNTSKKDIAALMLLPNDLINRDSSEFISRFSKWADEQIQNRSGLVHVSDFWSYTGTPLPEKINKKEAELIHKLAQKAGYGIAPDFRYHHAKPAPDGNIVLFNEGHGDFFEPSKTFSLVAMALRLGTMVAKIDADVDGAELTTLNKLIDHNIELSPTEKRSLHAYLIWRLNTPINMTGLKARLEKLRESEKSIVNDILIRVALADGKVDPAEIKQLEKLYAALGLDKFLVSSDIHRLSSTKVVSKLPLAKSTQASTKFSLNEDILALHESETKDVQNMLGAIFVDDEAEPVATTHHTSPAISDGSLDVAHDQLYKRLASKDRWKRKEVAGFCQKLELMLDGAIETINDWSYEKVDSPVLDDDGDIFVDLEIVEELQG